VPPEWETYASAVQAGLRAADVICAPTVAVLDDLQRNYSFSTRTAVVPNGRAGSGRQAEKEPFVLAVGRFDDPAKNIASLQEARSAISWPVVLVGEGTPLGRLAASTVSDLVGRASIYAAPAFYEPFGLAILEAGLAGCALVVADIPSLREVWADAAVFVAPGDREALSAAIAGLIEDERRCAATGRRARRRAARYTPEAMASGYLQLYAGVLGRQRGEVAA
jgi:glycogen synthase